MTIETPHYGWFSDKQYAEHRRQGMLGSVNYQAADGTPVAITTVTLDDHHNTGWDDIRYVGKVSRYPID